LDGCTCTRCGQELHDFVKSGKAVRVCQRCGVKVVEPHDHRFWCGQCDHCGEYEDDVTKAGDFYIQKTDYGVTLVGYEGKDNAVVSIPEGVTRIKMGHMGDFSHHDEITELILPSTLTSIDSCSWMKNLAKVDVNEGLESIEQNALHGCPELKEIYIPETVTSIGYSALDKRDGLEITCHEGSEAHRFAEKEGIPVKLLPGSAPTTTDEPAQQETFTNKQPNGTVRHIVCICYDGPLSNQWKPQIQQYIIGEETTAGSTFTQSSRITFESFSDNSNLENDDSLKMKLMQVYGGTYGFAQAETLALKSVYKGAMRQQDGKTVEAKFFVLYED